MKTDLEIQKDVMEQLRWQPILEATEIGVSVKNGIATLSGQVSSYPKKLAAEKAVKKVSGVKAVIEDIRVVLHPGHEKTDQEIAEAVVNVLKWNSAVTEENIKINVENGFVTLSGQVEWAHERAMAEIAVEIIKGVRLVVNQITIKPKPVLENIKRKIDSAFQRHASIDSAKIKINVVGNTVILSGTVRAYSEKEDAEDAAWDAPGVNRVENQIEVAEDEYAFD